MNKLLERMGIHMPQYYKLPEGWRGRGKIKIIYSPFWRNTPVIREIIPFYVGNKVRFRVCTENPNPSPDVRSNHVVYESIDGKYIALEKFNGTSTEVKGRLIRHTGDIVYCIGTDANSYHTEVFFTATVISWDTVRNNWFWMIMAAIFGGIFSLIVGILLGIIKINTAWIVTW
jgi:hypothetical protein